MYRLMKSLLKKDNNLLAFSVSILETGTTFRQLLQGASSQI